ncbi:MAG TPA: hypothetical protein VGD99_10020 [Anaerolineae bacterium]
MITRIEGYLLIPHELLHVIGYRLVGQRCTYRWGDHQVRPAGPMLRRERLVGLLFPVVTCVAAWLILLPLSGVAFFYGGMKGVIILTMLASLALIYAFASIGDLRQAYLLLYEQEPHHKTPFDFLFWPILTERIEGVRRSSLAILVCLILLYAAYLWLR